MKSNLDENIKIDSCLTIINKAIEIDNNNFSAYYNKSKFLTLKKDIKESIKNNQKMIELRPNQPLWKIQRGLFFDIENRGGGLRVEWGWGDIYGRSSFVA